MYLIGNLWPSKNGKSYKTAYLRESHREGPKVKSRILANLSHCSEDAAKDCAAHMPSLGELPLE